MWDYNDNLLKKIDDVYCLNKNSSNGKYSYESRNVSTTHVHLMLNTALMEVMDNCECLFFLNTPKSINLKKDIANRTKSSWIYSEISMSRMIRKVIPSRLCPPQIASESILACFSEGLEMSYDVDLSHLQNVNSEKFVNWIKSIPKGKENSKVALDELYNIFPLPKQKEIKIIYG